MKKSVPYIDAIVEPVMEAERSENRDCGCTWIALSIVSSFLALTFFVVGVLLAMWDCANVGAGFLFLAAAFDILAMVGERKNGSLREPQ